MSQTIEQERAAFALTKIHGLGSEVKHKEFRSYASALPAMIHMNGLGQALAFCHAKGSGKNGKAYEKLYEIVSDWLTKKGQPLEPAVGDSRSDALTRLTVVALEHYRVAQVEALALMDWVRKFAISFLVESESKKEEGEASA